MATLSISWTIADNKVVGIKDDFAAHHGWTATIQDPNNQSQTIPNPETQNAFIKRKVGEFIKDSVKARRATLAVDLARNSSIQDSDTNVVLS